MTTKKLSNKTAYLVLVFIVALFAALLFISNYSNTEVAANQTVNGYVEYTDANGCVNQPGAITLSDSDYNDVFIRGRGVDQGTRVVYIRTAGGASPQYNCCLEQTGLQGTDIQNCENLTPPRPNPGSVNPWISTSQGNFYVKLGVPNTSNPTSGYFASNPNKSSIAEFTFSSAQDQSAVQLNPPSLDDLSYENFTLFNYRSSALRPPPLSGFENWYDYMVRLAEVNVGLNTQAVPATLSGNLAGTFDPSNEPAVYIRNGDLDVQSGTNCNTKALIFVQGNLNVDPPFRISNKQVTYSSNSEAEGQACLFVVAGDVNVSGGGNAVNTGDAGAPNFDLVEAGIVSDGRTVLEYNNNEPLKVYGFLAGRYGDFQRDVNNNDIPSVWIEYDPRYMQIFKNELKINRFSTREKGFVSSLF
jgi:hypothetical protein